MPYIPDQQINQGLFLPTTYVYDVGRLYEVEVNSSEFKELIVRLYQSINNIVVVLNQKDSALYNLEEFVDGAIWFNRTLLGQLDLRPEFRRTYDIGTLNAGVTTIAHGLTIATNANFEFVRIYGTASGNAGGNFYPLPWASASGATNIELRVNNINIVITNNSGLVFGKCTIVLHYLKN